jgi:hypothetical protein
MTTKKHNKAGEAIPMSLDQQCEALEQAYLETEGELEAVSIDNVTHDALVAGIRRRLPQVPLKDLLSWMVAFRRYQLDLMERALKGTGAGVRLY